MPFSNLLTSARLTARPGTTVLLFSLALAGCGNSDLIGGSFSDPTSPSSPNSPSSPTSPNSPNSPSSPNSPNSPATGNRAPSINGIPPSTTRVNQQYNFSPSAFDPDGNALRFEISGKPAWATFDTSSGRLSGTPPSGTSGTFGGIEIRVTDGSAKASLPVFAIVVLEAAAATQGKAVLSWTRPTTYTDGKSMADLAGYRIYYGPSTNPTATVREITDPGALTTSIDGLAPGTWYFSISAFNSTGVESRTTSPVSLTIG